MVKIADHEHNSDAQRLARLDPAARAHLERKYSDVADLIDAAREHVPPA